MTHLEQKSKHNTASVGWTTADSKEKGKSSNGGCGVQFWQAKWWAKHVEVMGRKNKWLFIFYGKVHGKLWELDNKLGFEPVRFMEKISPLMMKMMLTMMTTMTRTFQWSTSSARMCPPECDIARFRWSRCPPSLSLLCCPLRFQPIRRWEGTVEP